jgi:hypothetical protein
MEIIGRELELGLGVEDTRGTKASSSKWIKNVSANLVERAEMTQDESTRGVFEDEDGRKVIKKFIEGDTEMYLYADAFGYLAYNLYGGVSSSLVSDGVYDHTFNLEQSALAPSLTAFVKDGSVQQLAFKNSHISTLELTASPDERVNLSVSVMAKDAKDDTSTPSYDTEYDFIGKDVTVKIADTEGGLTSATPLCVKELSLTFDKGLISDYCLGSYNPADIYMSKMMIEGSVKINFEDETYKDLYLSNDSKYMEITIEGDAFEGKATKPSLTLTLYKVQVQDWNREGGKDDLVTEEISFKAYYNTTDEKQSQLVLRNLTEEYAEEASA